MQDPCKLLEKLLISPQETELVEFKHNNFSPELIGEYISALSNSAVVDNAEQAYMVWGIEDSSGSVIGTKFDPQKSKFENQALEMWLWQNLRPPPYFRFCHFEYNSLPVVILSISPVKESPVRFKGVEYIRIGSSKTRLHDKPERLQQFWRNALLGFKPRHFAWLRNVAWKVRMKLLEPFSDQNRGRQRLTLDFQESLNLLDNRFGISPNSMTARCFRGKSDTAVSSFFEKLPRTRSLLLVGDVGSGKTYTLFELATNLLASFESDLNSPVPVIFRLNDWRGEEKTLVDWLVKQFDDKYEITKDYSIDWIREGNVSILLDGLDEIEPASLQQNCLNSINAFLRSTPAADLVVTCRETTYAAFNCKLRAQTALSIHPLNTEEIAFVIGASLDADHGDNGDTKNMEILLADRSFLQTATSPFMLQLMQEGKLMLPGSNKTWLPESVIDQYIERLLYGSFPPKVSDSAPVGKYISLLALQMKGANEVLFDLSRITPTYLSLKWLIVYLLPFFLLGLWFGVYGLLNSRDYSTYGRIAAILAPIIFPIFSCLLALWIVPVGRLAPNWTAIKSYHLALATWPLSIVRWCKRHKILTTALLIGYLGFWLSVGLSIAKDPVYILIHTIGASICLPGFIFLSIYVGVFGIGSMFGSIVRLPFWLRGSDLRLRTRSNELVWDSLKNGLLSAILTPIAAYFIFFAVVPCFLYVFDCVNQSGSFFLSGFQDKIEPRWEAPVLFDMNKNWCPALLLMAFGFLATGGFAFMQHFWLRFLLFVSHALPWDLVSFLDYMKDRELLDKECSQYRFRHRDIRDHLAQAARPPVQDLDV